MSKTVLIHELLELQSEDYCSRFLIHSNTSTFLAEVDNDPSEISVNTWKIATFYLVTSNTGMEAISNMCNCGKSHFFDVVVPSQELQDIKGLEFSFCRCMNGAVFEPKLETN